MIKFIKEHRRGLIATISFHGLLITLFIFWGFKTPLPLPAEEGILINFGETDFGSGTIEPETSPIEEQEYIPPSSSRESSDATETEEEILEQDFEESAAIENDRPAEEKQYNRCT